MNFKKFQSIKVDFVMCAGLIQLNPNPKNLKVKLSGKLLNLNHLVI